MLSRLPFFFRFNLYRFFGSLLVLALLILPTLVLAQTGSVQVDAEANSIWIKLIAGIGVFLSAVGGSSIISAFVRSKGGPIREAIMGLIDVIAFNWLRARNDDRVNQPPKS